MNSKITTSEKNDTSSLFESRENRKEIFVGIDRIGENVRKERIMNTRNRMKSQMGSLLAMEMGRYRGMNFQNNAAKGFKIKKVRNLVF